MPWNEMSLLPAFEPKLWTDESEAREARLMYPEEGKEPRELSPLETKPLDREAEDVLDSRSDDLSKLELRCMMQHSYCLGERP